MKCTPITLIWLSLTAASYGQYSRAPGPNSALAYRTGSWRSPSRPAVAGYSARNYIYGGYGMASASPIAAPTPTRPLALAMIGGSAAPRASTTMQAIPTSPVLPYYYGFYGLPSTYYQPTVQSYAPYATPGVGYEPGRAPVYAVTYGNGATLSQSYTGASNADPTMFGANLGQLSYTNNRGSFGQDLFPGLAPGQITYGISSQAAATPPGYYGNYVAPAGATYFQIISGATAPTGVPTITVPGTNRP